MNVGHELAGYTSAEDKRSAIGAYTCAIALLEPIATESLDNVNALAAAVLNRGQLLREVEGLDSCAAQDFVRARSLLEPHLDASNPWIRRNYCGALVNYANLQLDSGSHALALANAQSALAATKAHSGGEPIDLRLELLARRALCDAIGQALPSLTAAEQEKLAATALACAGEGLELLERLGAATLPETFVELWRRLFHFAAQLVARQRPAELEDFLRRRLDAATDPRLAPHLHSSARTAIRGAVDTLAQDLTDSRHAPDDAGDQAVQIARSLLRFHQSLNLP